MLVLGRTIGDQILIGDDIVITIVGVVGPHVRVGIKAPPEIRVDRREVREQRRARPLPPPIQPDNDTDPTEFAAGIPL